MYYEESDLCKRVSERGVQVGYTPSAHVMHHVGGSSRSKPWWFFRAMRVSRTTYAKKHLSSIRTNNVVLHCSYRICSAYSVIRGVQVLFIRDYEITAETCCFPTSNVLDLIWKQEEYENPGYNIKNPLAFNRWCPHLYVPCSFWACSQRDTMSILLHQKREASRLILVRLHR